MHHFRTNHHPQRTTMAHTTSYLGAKRTQNHESYKFICLAHKLLYGLVAVM